MGCSTLNKAEMQGEIIQQIWQLGGEQKLGKLREDGQRQRTERDRTRKS